VFAIIYALLARKDYGYVLARHVLIVHLVTSLWIPGYKSLASVFQIMVSDSPTHQLNNSPTHQTYTYTISVSLYLCKYAYQCFTQSFAGLYCSLGKFSPFNTHRMRLTSNHYNTIGQHRCHRSPNSRLWCRRSRMGDRGYSRTAYAEVRWHDRESRSRGC
jgi:hypothetical protein